MAAYSRSLSGNAQYGQAITLYKSSQPLSERTLIQMTNFVEAQAPNMPTQPSTLGYSAAATAATPNRATTQKSAHSNPSRQNRQPGTLSYCYVHGYGGHTGTKCREMLKDPKAYDHQHLITTTHTAVVGGSTWRN